MGLMAQSDDHVPIGVPRLLSTCPGTCLSTFLAAAHGHTRVPTQHTRGVHSGAG